METRGKDIEVIDIFVDGNTLRAEHAYALPAEETPAVKKVSMQAQANRERFTQMNLGYVAFLAAAAVVTVLICVNYLRLQAQYTAVQKETTSLEAQLSELKLENDAEYNRIIAGVNLEHVKETAMNKLGMTYASIDQIVEYDAAEHDYVKQYQDIPENG